MQSFLMPLQMRTQMTQTQKPQMPKQTVVESSRLTAWKNNREKRRKKKTSGILELSTVALQGRKVGRTVVVIQTTTTY